MTPESLLTLARTCQIADAARMARRPAGHPRAAWRAANPAPEPRVAVRDTHYKTHHLRALYIAGGTATVLGLGSRFRVIERIDLRAPDAAARLARYMGA